MMEHEHTALNSTNTTTKTEKKGYIPLVVSTFTALLFVLAFYAGQMRGSSSLSGSGGTCAAAGQSCMAKSCCYGDCHALGHINICECLPEGQSCGSSDTCCSGKCTATGFSSRQYHCSASF